MEGFNRRYRIYIDILLQKHKLLRGNFSGKARIYYN